MIFDSPYFRSYLFTALGETPLQLRFVLSGMTDEQSNARIDPERFTLREAVAHLADWETVFRERILRIVTEDNPELPNIDEGVRGAEKKYSETDWRQQLELFIQRRDQMICYLRDLPIESWDRKGLRPEIGHVSIKDLVQLMPLHDIYHMHQAREYLS